jgi:4-diphosphocytidyl-2-C-methyl-D-erythritol kinase
VTGREVPEAGSTVLLTAPAKLTVSLAVTGVRADGMHLIDAEMVTLDLADLVTLTFDGEGAPGDEGTPEDGGAPEKVVVSVSGPYADGVPADDTNLAARALALVGLRVRVALDKRIPHGGGLGGGSADAAAVLRWAGWTDVAGAAVLGADVPFCLVGGRARVTGIGEVVAPLPPEARTFTLVLPPVHCATPAIYRAWDDMGGPRGDHGNDLEPAVLAVVPEMAAWRERITDASGVRPRLAGSGSTWFLHGDHAGVAGRLPGATVIVARTT